MPLDSTSVYSITDHSQGNRSANFQRIRQWIRLVELLRGPLTPSVEDEDDFFSSSTTPVQQIASEVQHQAPIWQRLPEDEQSGNVSVLRLTHPIHRLGIQSPVTQRDYPFAPRMRTIPLPQVTDEFEAGFSTATTTSPALSYQGWPIGRPPIVASDRPSRRSAHHRRVAVQLSAGVSRPEEVAAQHRVLASELRHHGSVRPVVKPVLSDMPPYNGHCWGARDEDMSVMRGLNIHFPYSTIPATNPPLKQMKLARPFGGMLVVRPTIENQFVSIVDVQRTVIAWMRWEHPHVQDEGMQLIGRAVAGARDGTTKEVDVWIWRGLTEDSSETGVWKIIL